MQKPSPRPPAEAGAKPTPTKMAPPAVQARALADTVVSSLVDRLIAEAGRKGGHLSVADLNALKDEFAKKADALQKVFQKSFEDYVRARERSAWDQARQYPFDRIIVRKFANLFPQDGVSKLKPGLISRRVLPGFFLALSMMLGEEVIESYQEKCRKIIGRVTNPTTGDLDWYHAYDDPEANAVTLDSLGTIALHFDALDRRADWFVDLINNHLAPADTRREGEAAANWQLNRLDFMRFLDSLFKDLRGALKTETGRLQITKAHGADACVRLLDIMSKIDAAIAAGRI